MKLLTKIALTLSLTLTSTLSIADQPIPVHYDGFDLALSCETKTAIYVSYKATKDGGNEKRKHSFYVDKNLPRECQQSSTGTYKLPYMVHSKLNKKISYDRGHLVPANHMDHSKQSIRDTNYMTNIVPMTRTVNRQGGAWYATEMLTECTRDIKDFEVHAGIVMGDDKRNDYFIASHGIKTPDFLWKVLFDGKTANAWIIPNSHNAVKENLPKYQTTIADIEDKAGIKLPIPSHMKNFKNPSWNMPSRCDYR